MKVDIPRRMEVIHEIKKKGGLIAAVLPIHYSRGLLRAFDIYPVEVWGPPQVDVSFGGAHLQPYVCSIVHNALSFLKMGKLNVADLILVPHTCDSLQGLGSILLDFVKPEQSVYPLYLPRGHREEDVAFLADEFRTLYDKLSRLTGRSPSDKELILAIQREETADKSLSLLYRTRRELTLKNSDFYRLVRSREFLPAERFQELVNRTMQRNKGTPPTGIPILLSGIVPEPMEVLDAIGELGGFVVDDDLACCGRRRYHPGKSSDPCRRMAERILFAPPDTTRGNSIEGRVKHLQSLLRQGGAKGVIFYYVKFCEPELFDLPVVCNRLKTFGIPTVSIEVDINDPLPHQAVTRIGAFLEILDL